MPVARLGYHTGVGWWILGGVVVVCVLLWIAHRVGLIDLSDKSRKEGGSGGGAGMLGIVDEIFAPARHEAQLEREKEARLPIPAPIPGDGDNDIYNADGPVRIMLDSDGKPLR